MDMNSAYKVTGFIVLVVGILFLLRDIGFNYIGNTSGWTIVLVLIGSALLAGKKSAKMQTPLAKKK